MAVDVAVQVVNFRTAHHLGACLRSVLDDVSSSGLTYEVLVLDNASGDDLGDLARRRRGDRVRVAVDAPEAPDGARHVERRVRRADREQDVAALDQLGQRRRAQPGRARAPRRGRTPALCSPEHLGPRDRAHGSAHLARVQNADGRHRRTKLARSAADSGKRRKRTWLQSSACAGYASRGQTRHVQGLSLDMGGSDVSEVQQVCDFFSTAGS
jgi:hypothetical protein